MTFVSELKPTSLWTHFDKILTIPRGSKNEEAIASYVLEVAQRCGHSYKQDETGNIVVLKPATPGRESDTITILQSHLDMVNEKNSDVVHDFDTDPIQPREKDGYLLATGTTLGSDNGIGVAASLAVMEDNTTPMGAVELLFTVDEETGLTGAAGLEPGFLDGKRLINLDTEEERAIYVGCAGGAGVNLHLQAPSELCSANSAYSTVRLFGLKGGHSGVDIHLQRGNAIKLLVRALAAADSDGGLEVVSLSGGNMHNAIPREATATIRTREDDDATLQTLELSLQTIQAEYKPAEPGFSWETSAIDPPASGFSPESGKNLLHLLNSLPHGVVTMSYDIPDLVETSANLATAAGQDGDFKIHISNRSSVQSALDALQESVASAGLLAGARVEFAEGYPGWKPDLRSPILAVAQTVFTELFEADPEVKAIHAGLECGLIGERYPGMDMVSIGPQIEFPHSPDERVRIGSVGDFYSALLKILERLGS